MSDAGSTQIDLSQLNEGSFVERFGALYEHSPWIAEKAWHTLHTGSSCTLSVLAEQLKQATESASDEQKLALIRAHPDLVGKAAVKGELTEESTEEQASARLDQCSEQEFARFNELNAAYEEKFGFPFVMAVRNSNRVEILASFEQRLHNDAEQEFRTALDNIHTIAWL